MKLIFTLFFIFLSLPLMGQNVFEFGLNGNGARAAGLGYAFTGVADDASAISWNPAGLTQLYQMEASVVGRLGAGNGSIDGFSDIGINTWDFDVKSNFQLNFLSFVVPFIVGDINVVGGIALRRIYDFSSEITETIETDGGVFTFFDNTVENKVDGGINAFAPSLGVQLNDMFSVGITANIFSGTEDGTVSNDEDGFISTLYDYKIEYSGAAIDIGVLFKPIQKVSIGVNFNLPHTRTFKVTKSLGDSAFFDFNGDEVDLDTPMFFRIGVAFRATDNLLLAFDYNNRPVSKVVWRVREYFGEDEDIGGEDLNSIHFGAEYLITSGNSVVPVRLGFYTNPTNGVDASGDQVVENVLTAGIGFILGNVILDGSFEWGGTKFVENDEFDITFTGNSFRMSLGAVIHFGGDE